MDISLEPDKIVKSISDGILSKMDEKPDMAFISPKAYEILSEVFMPELKNGSPCFYGVIIVPHQYSTGDDDLTLLKVIWDE